MADGTYRRGPNFAAGVLLVRDDHLLMTLRSVEEQEPFTWSCFGGMAEPGESPMQVARRECLEESGIDVSHLHLALVDTYSGPGFQFLTYLARVGSHEVAVASSESQLVGAFPLGSTAATLWSGMPVNMHSGMSRMMAKPGVAAVVVQVLGLVKARIAGTSSLDLGRPVGPDPRTSPPSRRLVGNE